MRPPGPIRGDDLSRARTFVRFRYELVAMQTVKSDDMMDELHETIFDGAA